MTKSNSWSPPGASLRLGISWPLLLGAGACVLSSGPSRPTSPLGSTAATGTFEELYPRRASGCELILSYTAVPPVPAWDDLGVAEAICHIDDPVAECLRRLRSEACRMGGDVIYGIPRKPLRPRDKVVVYRAQVAHTRLHPAKTQEDPELPPPASPEELAGPVVPLPSAGAAGGERTPRAGPARP